MDRRAQRVRPAVPRPTPHLTPKPISANERATTTYTENLTRPPEHLRAALRGHSLAKQLALIESMSTAATAAVDHRITTVTLQSICARIRFLTGQLG